MIDKDALDRTRRGEAVEDAQAGAEDRHERNRAAEADGEQRGRNADAEGQGGRAHGCGDGPLGSPGRLLGAVDQLTQIGHRVRM